MDGSNPHPTLFHSSERVQNYSSV